MSPKANPYTGPRNNGGPSLDLENLTDFGDFMDSWLDEGKAYIEVQRELVEMNAYQQVAKLSGGLLTGLLIAVFGLGVMAFCSIALAIWVGSLLANMALGFLVVGGLYLLVFLAFWFIWRGGMKDRFTLNIINSFYDDKD